MMSEVTALQVPAPRRRVSRWAAGASALIAIVPTAFVVVNELESEFEDGGTIESHEVVTLAWVVVVLAAISLSLGVSALKSTTHPEWYLAAATGGFVGLGLITAWLAGFYALATVASAVAWWTGRTPGGPTAAAQGAIAVVSAAAVFALYLGENALSDALYP